MIVGIRHFTDRIGEGIGQPRFDSVGGEELMHVQPGITIALGRLSPESPGTLYISNRRVVWLSDTDRDKGYAVDFLSISLHAVSRDPETYPSPCIYTQVMHSCLGLWKPIYESLSFDVIMVSSFSDIEAEDAKDDEFEGSDAECPDETYLSKITEMRLVPHDPNQLDTLFDIFCQCVELNPEPREGDDEENSWIFGEDFTDDGDQAEWHLSEDLANPIGQVNGNHDLAHSVLHLQINDQRFEDAEEMEDANHN